MLNNSNFRNDIIQKSAELTSKNVDMVRLNNVAITREMRQQKLTQEKSRQRAAQNYVRQLEVKYKQTSEDPYSRKLFIKNIGSINQVRDSVTLS